MNRQTVRDISQCSQKHSAFKIIPSHSLPKKNSNTCPSAQPDFPQVWFAAYKNFKHPLISLLVRIPFCLCPCIRHKPGHGFEFGVCLFDRNLFPGPTKHDPAAQSAKSVKVSSIIWYAMIYYSAPAWPVLIYYMKY